MTPEQKARVSSDKLMKKPGWYGFKSADANIHTAGVAPQHEFPHKARYSVANYMFCRFCKTVGVIDAEKDGNTLTDFDMQSARYTQGLAAWRQHLPFCYESNGIETHLKQLLLNEAGFFFVRLMAVSGTMAQQAIDIGGICPWPLPLLHISAQHHLSAEVDPFLSLFLSVDTEFEINLTCITQLRQTVLQQSFSC